MREIIKKHYRSIIFVALGANISSVLYGAVLGATDMVLIGGIGTAMCVFILQASNEDDQDGR